MSTELRRRSCCLLSPVLLLVLAPPPALAQSLPSGDTVTKDVMMPIRRLGDERCRALRGFPRRDLFGADSLHMNSAGYALWRSVLSPELK